MSDPWNWEIEDLKLLKGQPESLRVEFKNSIIFEKGPEKVAEEISREVSAFANTEGGIIVIGVAEERVGKTRQAGDLDQGISVQEWSPERIQQMTESNIYPSLLGIRFRPIFLDGTHERFYLVIYIPKGPTAYQARDYIYYGRSEYESKALRDHEIRLRMNRGKIPEAIIELSNLKVHKTNETRGSAEAGTIFIDGRNYQFDLMLRNTGEVMINQFKLRYQITPPFTEGEIPAELVYIDRPPNDQYIMGNRSVMVFPGDSFRCVGMNHNFDSEKDFFGQHHVLHWKIFLPDRYPVVGEIDLAEAFKGIPFEE